MAHSEEMSHHNASEDNHVEDREKSRFSIPPRIERVHDAYAVYVATQADAVRIVKGFWEALGNTQVLADIDRGMLHPEDDITSGPRTSVANIFTKEEKEAGYEYRVFISQNGPKLSEKTETAVYVMSRNLGIE